MAPSPQSHATFVIDPAGIVVEPYVSDETFHGVGPPCATGVQLMVAVSVVEAAGGGAGGAGGSLTVIVAVPDRVPALEAVAVYVPADV